MLAHAAGAAVLKQWSGSAVFRGKQNSLLSDLTELAKVTYFHKCICLRLPRLRKSLISDSLPRSPGAHLAGAVHAAVETSPYGRSVIGLSEAQIARRVCPTATPPITCLAVAAECR